MGKCVRIRGSKPPPPPSPAAEAAACLMLRSGRRVPVVVAVAAAAACSSPRKTSSSRRHRGSAAADRCGAEAEAAKRACGGGRPHGRALAGAQQLGGCRSDAEPQLPSQAEAGNSDGANGCGDDSFQPPKKTPPLDGDELVVVEVKQEQESKKGAAGQPAPASPGLEAEMEAFFAAAELAERRRFAEAYNYDVALDRPLEGRFEWAPVTMST